MNRLHFLTLILIPAFVAAAPERILPRTLVLRTEDYYRQQAETWRMETGRDRSRADAWLNFYASASFGHQSPQDLDKIVSDMTASVPDSYEWLVVKGWHEGYQATAEPFLERAYAMKPERPESYGLLQLNSELDLKLSERQLFSKLLLETNQISSSLIQYSYNVLMSVEQSSILITEGESTTAPLFVLQDVLHIRRDVSVLDLDLLSNVDYLEMKLRETGLELAGPLRPDNLRASLCSLLPQNNQDRKFYYALTVSKDNLSQLKESLYVVGLASMHSLTNIDNVARIRRNLEKEFLLDYLRVDFNGESPDATGKVLSANYLVPMLLLFESYIKDGKVRQASDLRELMEQIAAGSGKASAIAHFLGAEPGDVVPYFPSVMDVKSLDGKFRYFSGTLYAQESEVTNEQFNRFLKYLKVNGLTELHEKFDFDFREYTEPALSMMKSYSADRVPVKKSRYFTNYPAVNISYEGAVAYCDWLTDQYNHAAGRKFKKVKFRLPSIDEWQLAAASIKDPLSWKLDDQAVEVRIAPDGHDMTKNAEKKVVSLKDPEILYPWFRYWKMRSSPVNSRGCYLGNFKAPDTITCPGIQKLGLVAADGFMSMGPTESYFPNDIGLYDVVGNAAEMTLDKGKACGGSWNHPPEESTIRSVNVYTRPDAATGFRVFMEIVEK